jgi:Fic family protein
VPDWDEDSPRLRQNLTRILEEIVRDAEQRKIPTVEMARRWQMLFMQGLEPTNPQYVGKFRGEPSLKKTRVKIGNYWGVPPANVAEELQQFQQKLQAAVAQLDKLLAAGAELDRDELAAVIDLCAWAHAEWIRIHPFANGNGRTARLWANFLALRYGLPPFVRLRPRPDDGYGDAGTRAMKGEWESTASVFRQMLKRFLDEFKE